MLLVGLWHNCHDYFNAELSASSGLESTRFALEIDAIELNSVRAVETSAVASPPTAVCTRTYVIIVLYAHLY